MNRTETANQLYQKLYGEDQTLQQDREFRDMMKDYIYGDVYQHGQLDLKLRELILIVVQTTNYTLKQLQAHVAAGLKVGLTPIEIKEAVYQCTPYIGYAKVEEALDIVNRVFADQGISLPLTSQSTTTSETRYEKGLDAQVKIFGEAMREGYANAPQEKKHITKYLSEHCFGDFYTRTGLDLKTRELLTFVMLSCLGGCENQLRSHVNGNFNMGNDRALLLETITQCQPYIGFPRTLNAVAIIDETSGQQ